jgi:hypothetical protein
MSDKLFKAIEKKASIEEVKRILKEHSDKEGFLPLHHALWKKKPMTLSRC